MPRKRITALLLLAVCGACGDPLGLGGGGREELWRNAVRWQQQGIDDYRYVLTAGCECLPEWVRPTEVLVRDGETIALRYVNNYDPNVWSRFRELDSVAKLFDFVEDAYDRDAARVEVEYHPEFGVPTQITVDYDVGIADDEISITVREFAPTADRIPPDP